MTRRQTPAPANINLIKTSRGSWIAVEEIWEGNRLVSLNPMRTEEGDIAQRRERKLILAVAEKAEMLARLRRAEKKLRELTDGPPARVAATG